MPLIIHAQYHVFKNNMESTYIDVKWAPWEQSTTHIGVSNEGYERYRIDVFYEGSENPDMQIWVRFTRMEGIWFVYTVEKANYKKSDIPVTELEESSHASELLAKNKLSRIAKGDTRNAVINFWVIGTGYAYILLNP